MGFIEGVLHYKWVILFYLALALIVYLNRKRIEVQAKFIFMYKTQFGIKFIEKFSKKFKEWIRLFGYMGMGIGFAGIILISIIMLKGVYELIFVPSAPPTISPFIPGVPIPGSPIGAPPFFESIIALFLVIVIHEFSHGIVAKIYDLKIKNTGFMLFGPIPGAFVEPDEKSMEKKSDVVKHSIFAAGPFSNILTGTIILLILGLFFVQGNVMDEWLPRGMTAQQGVVFGEIVEGSPAEQYGIKSDVVYTKINSQEFTNRNDFSILFYRIKPGETVTLEDSQGASYEFIAGTNPEDKTLGYLGVESITTKFAEKSQTGLFLTFFAVFKWLGKLFFWFVLISFGLGLANLLPIGPVDGGRMLHTALVTAIGEKKGVKVWTKITAAGVVIIIALLFVPIIKSIIGV